MSLKTMKIEIAETAGYCFGVERAIQLAEKAADDSSKDARPVRTLGPLIHNEHVLDKMEREKDIRVVDDLSGTRDSTVVIRAHGIPPELMAQARAQNNEVIDATCPFVTRAQELARELVKEGYQLIILGEKNHPEMVGVIGHAGGKALIINDVSELPKRDHWHKVGIVVQTTQRPDKLAELVNHLIPVTHEIKVCNTICDATDKLQDAARKLAKKTQCMLVIGGKQSGNTKRLAQICKEVQPRTHFISQASELEESWFIGIDYVGITAGASTPDFSIEETVEWLTSYSKRRDSKAPVKATG